MPASRPCCSSGPAASSTAATASRTSAKWASSITRCRSPVSRSWSARWPSPAFPLLSGFYSKDAILASVLGFSWTHPAHWILFILPALAAAITAFYMMRLYLLTFHTTARDEHVHEHAHESPRLMWVPLVVSGDPVDRHRLVRPARPSAIRWATAQYAYEGGRGLVGLIAEAQPRWADQLADARSRSGALARGLESAGGCRVSARGARLPYCGHHHRHRCHGSPGVFMAWLVYSRGGSPRRRRPRFWRRCTICSVNKFYFDELYRATFVAGVLKLAAFGKWFDRVILDGIADGSARWVVRTGVLQRADPGQSRRRRSGQRRRAAGPGRRESGRKGQTGRVRNYILALTTVGAVVVFVFVWIW